MATWLSKIIARFLQDYNFVKKLTFFVFKVFYLSLMNFKLINTSQLFFGELTLWFFYYELIIVFKMWHSFEEILFLEWIYIKIILNLKHTFESLLSFNFFRFWIFTEILFKSRVIIKRSTVSFAVKEFLFT